MCFNYILIKRLQSLLIVQLGKPSRSICIARHAPIATRRERARADLGPVGQATAFKLLLEETPQENPQPFYDFVSVIVRSKRFIGKIQNFLGRETIPQNIIEEKVMQLVGPHKIFGFLRNLIVRISRQ